MRRFSSKSVNLRTNGLRYVRLADLTVLLLLRALLASVLILHQRRQAKNTQITCRPFLSPPKIRAPPMHHHHHHQRHNHTTHAPSMCHRRQWRCVAHGVRAPSYQEGWRRVGITYSRCVGELRRVSCVGEWDGGWWGGGAGYVCTVREVHTPVLLYCTRRPACAVDAHGSWVVQ